MILPPPFNSADPEIRAEAADYLADLYERGQFKARELPAQLSELLEFICKETDVETQEAMLNALNHGMIRFNGDPKQFNWKPLLDFLPRLHPSCLAEALPILSLSGTENIRSIIQPYTKHKDTTVREAAGFALDELDMMGL